MGLRVAELFAGVGGFRVGLQDAGHSVVWSNQYEPTKTNPKGKNVQHASECYVKHFGSDGHVNKDIHKVSAAKVTDHDLLVGGFPCGDYSRPQATRGGGLHGKRGKLWWQLARIVRKKRPDYLLLENVDRLLHSPKWRRGRDFGMVLRSLSGMGYRVEWRTLNAADYGFPQKRRRIFIFAANQKTDWGDFLGSSAAERDYVRRQGFFARAFPCVEPMVEVSDLRRADVQLPWSTTKLNRTFEFDFQNAGVMVDRRVWTTTVQPQPAPIATLGSVLQKDVPEDFFIPDSKLARWKYVKGAKSLIRIKNGHQYPWKEGNLPFPDRLDQPARTMMTGEGAQYPHRANHIIQDPPTGRYRRLTPVECERLNGFDDDWTLGMPLSWRYFCMGNALVIGLVKRMGHVLAETVDGVSTRSSSTPVPLAESPVG